MTVVVALVTIAAWFAIGLPRVARDLAALRDLGPASPDAAGRWTLTEDGANVLQL
ncbi:MAG: hypothetical protein WEB03_00170 [Nitriliruptor sp.]|uniref:hypothetical protein n=1 Tax=Nitriliruptor sp. TaxID=2448056 RepID=UPI00349FE757